MKLARKILAGLAVCIPTLAYPQSQSVQQSGTVTAGHATSWTYNGIVQDGGTSTSPNINTLGIYGTGTPFCISNTKVHTGQYYNLCMGYSTDLSAANISLTPFGGAPNIPLNIIADGQIFPIGPGGLSSLMDQQFGSTQGDILYRGANLWAALPPSSSGFLAANGSGANPNWAAGTALTPATANTFLSNVTNGTQTPSANPIPSCPDASGNHLNYISGTGFVCGNNQAGTGVVIASGTSYQAVSSVETYAWKSAASGIKTTTLYHCVAGTAWYKVYITDDIGTMGQAGNSGVVLPFSGDTILNVGAYVMNSQGQTASFQCDGLGNWIGR